MDTFFRAIRQLFHDDEEHDALEEEEVEDHDISVQKGKRKSQKRATSKEARDWVEQYFLENWFIDEWICGGIILNEFFPFYQYCSYFPKQSTSEVAAINAAAHLLWEEGNISHAVPSQSLLLPRVYIVDVIIPQCSCMSFQQTGKLCIHLVAAWMEHFNGPCAAWTEIESANQRRNPMRGKPQAHREVKHTSDARITKDLRYVVDQLELHSSSAPKEDTATTPRPLIAGMSGANKAQTCMCLCLSR
ncbi:hypothetical protein JB92DRAFT_2888095 [Gautieria morchelliformis]|nr:hypothetical protein JB92DRAFT_2888095 [Gautieria morchelliformis]